MPRFLESLKKRRSVILMICLLLLVAFFMNIEFWRMEIALLSSPIYFHQRSYLHHGDYVHSFLSEKGELFTINQNDGHSLCDVRMKTLDEGYALFLKEHFSNETFMDELEKTNPMEGSPDSTKGLWWSAYHEGTGHPLQELGYHRNMTSKEDIAMERYLLCRILLASAYSNAHNLRE